VLLPRFAGPQAGIAICIVLFGFLPASGAAQARRLALPAQGRIPVAFVVSDGAVMIDFAGPWEVFEDVMVPSRGARMEDQHIFQPYTVSNTRAPIRASGGMRIVPDYTFDDAPMPQIIVIPAQSGDSAQMIAWIKGMVGRVPVVMSVCTGAFVLAKTGVLTGKPVTTHHDALDMLARRYPGTRIRADRRWVESDSGVFMSGGLSSGIDLALHIVDRYLGRAIATSTARTLEYESRGWMGDGAAVTEHGKPITAPGTGIDPAPGHHNALVKIDGA
jgi:transcriptional regulator GlxA family with amidase domain